jgi:uncharacterized membrane protein
MGRSARISYTRARAYLRILFEAARLMRTELLLRIAIVIVCLAGAYVSSFMLRKYVRAQQGQLTEPSVVTSPRAKIGRVPNAAIGLIYYLLIILLIPFLSPAHPLVILAALAAAGVAALISVYLAYSLLFVTRMPCAFCWTGHVINWSLLLLLAVLSKSS